MPIPEFRPDGYLPLGVYLATEEELAPRLGEATGRRRVLMARVSDWLGSPGRWECDGCCWTEAS